MALIKRLSPRIRVFRWDVKLFSKSVDADLPENPHPQPHPIVFLVRATKFSPLSPEAEAGHRIDVQDFAVTPRPIHELPYLLHFCYTEGLLHHILGKFELLGTLGEKNIDCLAHGLTSDFLCRFRFRPEFLNRAGDSVLVLLFDLRIPTAESIRKYKRLEDVLDEPEEIEAEIEGHLKRNLGMNVVGPKGLDEIKGALQVKAFKDEDDEEKVCPICLERLSEGAAVAETRCSHIFHRRCVYDWLMFCDNSCPMCIFLPESFVTGESLTNLTRIIGLKCVGLLHLPPTSFDEIINTSVRGKSMRLNFVNMFVILLFRGCLV